MGPTTGEIQEKAEKLGEELLGSCRTLDGPEDEMVTDLEGFAETLDQVVRLCDICGWWVDAHEIIEHDHESHCEQCDEERE